MSQVRKRRATDADPSSSRRQRPRSSSASPDADMSDEAGNGAPSSLDAMVKKMVRLALASEYSRLPIRRTDITAKVMGEQGSRQFKTVFETAQQYLRSKFGMEMVELPAREKVTILQRRAAQKTDKPSTTTKSWILTSTLPAAYRTPAIIPPTRAPSTTTESTYTALYSFIIAVILLNGGTLGEQKLSRYLRRMNAEDYTPVGNTEKLLARLCREGYLVRTREMDGGEEIIEFMVGPRGKVEVGSSGVAGLVREVYGHGRGGGGATGEDEFTQVEREVRAEFESRLRRSLGISGPREGEDEEERREEQRVGNAPGAGEARRTAAPSEAPRRSSRRATTAHESEEESSEESETDSVKDESEDESD